MAAVCPHCGYDFPLLGKPKPIREGIAYSPLADIALFIGQIAAIIGCSFLLLGTGLSLIERNWAMAFGRIITFFIALAVFVILQRVSDMD